MTTKEAGISRRDFLEKSFETIKMAIGSLVLASPLSSILSGCERPNGIPMRDFESKVLPFRIKLAEGWTAEDRNTFTEAIRGIDGKDARLEISKGTARIYIYREAGRTPEDYLKSVSEREERLNKFTHLSGEREISVTIHEIKDAELDGIKGKKISLSESYSNNKNLKGTGESTYVAYKDGALWTIRYYAEPEQFQQEAATFDKMVSTFQFIK